MAQDLTVVHEDVLERFSGLLKSGRLAHAYLFLGPEGVGKFETACAVAQMVNCEKSGGKNRPCGECSSCRRISSRQHPDVHILETPRGATIKIDDIRNLITQIQIKPFEAGKKVFIIRNSENFTLDAGNALLKTLEEPSDDTLMILTSAVPQDNLSTIRSRCHAMYFAPYANDKLADCLVRDYDINGPTASFLASFSEGCLAKAARLKDEKIMEFKNEVIDQFILSRDSENYIKKILADPAITKQMLDVLLTWVRDVLLLQSRESEARLVHRDRLQELKRGAQVFSFKETAEIMDEVVKTKGLLNDNLNVKIALNVIKESLGKMRS